MPLAPGGQNTEVLSMFYSETSKSGRREAKLGLLKQNIYVNSGELKQLSPTCL